MKTRLFLLLSAIVLLFNGCTGDDTSGVITGYRVYYEFELLHNDSVGREWDKEIEADGSPLGYGELFPAEGFSYTHISVTITENDKYPDIGRGKIELPIENGAVASTHITVRENRGRYSGNTAEWEVTAFCEAVYE